MCVLVDKSITNINMKDYEKALINNNCPLPYSHAMLRDGSGIHIKAWIGKFTDNRCETQTTPEQKERMLAHIVILMESSAAWRLGLVNILDGVDASNLRINLQHFITNLSEEKVQEWAGKSHMEVQKFRHNLSQVRGPTVTYGFNSTTPLDDPAFQVLLLTLFLFVFAIHTYSSLENRLPNN